MRGTCRFHSLIPAAKAMVKLKERPVVFYCKNGQVSPQACAKLVKAGYDQVYFLSGGLSAWQSENLPVKKGRKG